MAGQLPPNPSLQNLRKQAKAFRRAVRAGDPAALEVVEAFLTEVTRPRARFPLSMAQLIVARRYGFPSWRRLSAYVDVVTRYTRGPHHDVAGGPAAGAADELLRLACLTYGVTEGQDDIRRQTRALRLLTLRPELARENIYTAAVTADADAVRGFLANDPGLVNRDGGPFRWPPLLYLAFSRIDSPYSPVDTARVLLDHGADPNAGFLSDGEPPPYTALAGVLGGGRDPANQPRHPDGLRLARLLLRAGADANDAAALANVGGNVADDAHLHLLFEFGLGRGSGGPWKARLGPAQPSPARLVQDQLLVAAHLGLVSRLAVLLRHCAVLGVDIDAVGMGPGHGFMRGRTAREMAMLGGHADAERLLAMAGGRPPRLDAVDQFAAACLRADRATAVRLLTDDPTLALRCAHHYLPWRAAVLDRPDALRLMAAIGLDVNTDNGGTPLHVAAYSGNLSAVKTLVQLGGDPTVPAETFLKPGDPMASIEDRTPLGLARYRGHREVAEYLAGLGPVA